MAEQGGRLCVCGSITFPVAEWYDGEVEDMVHVAKWIHEGRSLKRADGLPPVCMERSAWDRRNLKHRVKMLTAELTATADQRDALNEGALRLEAELAERTRQVEALRAHCLTPLMTTDGDVGGYACMVCRGHGCPALATATTMTAEAPR